jgi:hypothetical protein
MASVSASTVVLVVGPPRDERQAARADGHLRQRPGMTASASGTAVMLRICNFGEIRNANRFYS